MHEILIIYRKKGPKTVEGHSNPPRFQARFDSLQMWAIFQCMYLVNTKQKKI